MKTYRINSKVKGKYAIAKVINDTIEVSKYIDNKKVETIKTQHHNYSPKETLFKILLIFHEKIDKQKKIIDLDTSNNLDSGDLSKYFEKAMKYYLHENKKIDYDFLQLIKINDKKSVKVRLFDVELIEGDDCDELEVDKNIDAIKKSNKEVSIIKTLDEQFSAIEVSDIIDRPELIKNIDNKLKKYHIVGLIGGPGCGKSTLAACYMNKELDTTYFIKCDNIEDLKASFELQNDTVHFHDILDTAISRVENCAINSKESNETFLIIFDNISYDDKKLNENDTNSIKFEYLVLEMIKGIKRKLDLKKYKYNIIYTSRASREIVDDCNIEVSEFTEDEARQYLTDNIKFEYTDDEITNIINSTKLPIVLCAIKNYAKEKSKSYSEFSTLCSNTERITLTEVMGIIFKSFTSDEDQLCKKILRICSILYNTVNIDLLLEITNQLGLDTNGVRQAIRKLSENLNILVYRGKDELYLHRSYQEVILANCMSDNDNEKEVKKEIYDAVVNVFKKKINRYLTFSMDTAIQIEENILHINKMLSDKKYSSDDFYYLILSCMHHYGTNYSKENEYYINFSQYLSNKFEKSADIDDIEDDCIISIYGIYKSQISGTDVKDLIDLVTNQNSLEEDIIDFIDEDMIDLTEEEKHIILPKVYYALGSIYRSYKSSESDYKSTIRYYEKCYEYSKKQRKSTGNRDKIMFIFYTQYMLMSHFRIAQVHRRRREYDEYLDKLRSCNAEIEGLKKHIKYKPIIKNHLEYIEARLKNALAVYYMENNSSLENLKTGLQCELESYEIYIKYNILHEKKNIIYNLSLYYKKLAEKLKIKEKEYNIYIYMSLYFVELYRILRDKLGTVRYDNSGNYYNQKYLSVYKTLDFNKNISITKEDIIEKISSLGDEIAQDIMSYDNGNMIDKILNKYPINPDNAALFKECDELLTNALKQYSNQNTTLEQYANLDDNEREVNQYIARVIRYYASLNKKMYQITEDDTYYKNGVKFLKLSIELNKILNNNGQLALCLRELYVLYDMSAQKQSCFINECYKKKSYYKKECRLNKLVEILSDQFTKDVFGKLSDNDGYKKAYINKCKELEIELDF